MGGENRVWAVGWVELWECPASLGAGGGSSGRALRGSGDGPSGCRRGARVHVRAWGCGACCLAREPPLRPALVLVRWRLRRQLLRLSPGLRCGRLDFLRLAPGRPATGCWRPGFRGESWAPWLKSRSRRRGRPAPTQRAPLLPRWPGWPGWPGRVGRGGRIAPLGGGGFGEGAACRALPWAWGGSTASHRGLLTSGDLSLCAPLQPGSARPCLPTPVVLLIL